MSPEPVNGEQQPLLRTSSGGAGGKESSKPSSLYQSVVNFKIFFTSNPILVGTFCIQFLNYIAKHMVEVPTIKLFEQAICNRFFETSENVIQRVGVNIPEEYCKIAPIQSELAGLTGLKFTFDALPGLLTALYYGHIADRFGRRLVLALCCVGNMCALLWILFVCYSGLGLPVKLVWISSAFLCIGGSQRVAKGMNFTVVADSTEASHR